MQIKNLFFLTLVLVLLSFSQSSNAQTMIFSEQVNSDCVPTGASTSFKLGSSGVEVCCIVNLSSEASETTKVTFDVYKNGVNDFSTSLNIPAKTNCFWQSLIIKTPAEWTIKAVDSNGNVLSSGTITVSN